MIIVKMLGVIFHIPHPEVRIASATDASPTNRRASTISVFMTDEVSVRLIPVSFIALLRLVMPH